MALVNSMEDGEIMGYMLKLNWNLLYGYCSARPSSEILPNPMAVELLANVTVLSRDTLKAFLEPTGLSAYTGSATSVHGTHQNQTQFHSILFEHTSHLPSLLPPIHPSW